MTSEQKRWVRLGYAEAKKLFADELAEAEKEIAKLREKNHNQSEKIKWLESVVEVLRGEEG